MRVIVFDRELHEPLTVVSVPQWLADMAKSGQPIRLAPPPPPLDVRSYAEVAVLEDLRVTVVTLTFERVVRGRGGDEVLFWYAYADDPETALLLRSAFLPGQEGEVQRREKAAYVKGVFNGAGIEF